MIWWDKNPTRNSLLLWGKIAITQKSKFIINREERKRERKMQNNKDTVGNPYCKLLFSNLPLAFLFFNSSSVSFKDKQPYKDPQKNGVLGLVSEFQLEKRPAKQSMFQLPAKSSRDSAKTFWFSHGQDDSTTQVAIQSWICCQLRLESCNSTKSLLAPKSTRSNTEVIRIQRKSWKFHWKTEEGKKGRWMRSRGLHNCTYSCAIRLASFFTNDIWPSVSNLRGRWKAVGQSNIIRMIYFGNKIRFQLLISSRD